MAKSLLTLSVGDSGTIVEIFSARYFHIRKKGLDIGTEITVVDKFEDPLTNEIKVRVSLMTGQIVELDETEAACIVVRVKRQLFHDLLHRWQTFYPLPWRILW